MRSELADVFPGELMGTVYYREINACAGPRTAQQRNIPSSGGIQVRLPQLTQLFAASCLQQKAAALRSAMLCRACDTGWMAR